jgi:hypothetical protein
MVFRMDFPCELPQKNWQIRQVPISRHRLTRQRFWDEVAKLDGLEDGKITGRPISYGEIHGKTTFFFVWKNLGFL